MKPDIALYYPGQYWRDPDWAKNLVLFFDGVAMLIPEYMTDYASPDDYPIIYSLKEHGLFHVIRPEESIGPKETETLAGALVEIIASGRLDHLTRAKGKNANHSSFGSLSMSRLGFDGDPELAEFILQELKERGLASDSENGVSIPMHQTVRALILVLLAQILKYKGADMDLTLSPATDQWRLVEALSEIIKNPDDSSPSVGDIVSFDMAMIGVDLGNIPIEEVLDFRQQYYSQYRKYSLSVRKFARELSQMPVEERQLSFEQRQEELDEAARALKQLSKSAWRRPVSFALSFAGATWSLMGGDPVGALLAVTNTALGSGPTQEGEVGVYSYLFSARQDLY